MRRLVPLFVLAAACSNKPPMMTTQMNGVVAVPAQLAYLCVTPGCQETQTVEIDVQGTRRVAIKRVLLGGGGASDFSFMPSEMPPFIVGAGSSFTVDVTYTPVGAPAPGEAKLLVTYTDASPDDSPDRLPPGQLEIPLVRRIVGEPLLRVNPDSLQFGVVDAGRTASLTVHVSNEGFGNLVLQIAGVDAGQADFTAQLPSDGGAALAPDSGFDMAIVYAPKTEAYTKAVVTVLPTANDVAPGYVTVEGTSLPYPKLALQPGGDLDFGLLPKGHTRQINRELVNQGGQQLIVSTIQLADALGDVKLLAPLPDAGPQMLDPLQHAPLQLLIDGTTAGDVAATLTMASTDPTTPMYTMNITGTVTDPRIQLTPMALDFGLAQADGGSGKVPLGWVITRPIEIKNVGYGPLTVKNVTMVSGSAVQYALDSVPPTPFTLDRNARAAFNVQFQAEAVGLTFPGQVSVETDDAVDPFAVVMLSATVGTCMESCPIANGTPSCMGSMQTCQVGMCNTGYYDTNGSPTDGCECKEVSQKDPGQFCQDEAGLGTLNDEDSSATTFTGIIPTMGDIDLVEFYGNDQTGFFSDAYDVKIRLDSADPGIQMCVYHHGGSQPAAGTCFFSDEVCPGNRYYEKNGSWGTDDSADYVIKVFRTPQSAPTCSTYTLFMSNGR